MLLESKEVQPRSTFPWVQILFRQAGIGRLSIGIKHLYELDFPPSDPWSKLSQYAVAKLAESGYFDGKRIFEIGMGDGKLSAVAVSVSQKNGHKPSRIIGVDVEGSKLSLARYNLKKYGIPSAFYKGDAVDMIENWDELVNKPFDGRALICLPQVPRQSGANTTADVYGHSPSHIPFNHLDKYGLTLNAGVLTKLQGVSTGDAEALLVLSGRIPENLRGELIRQSGWKIKEIVASSRVKQDSDTPLEWMKGIVKVDDGQCFFDERGDTITMLQAIGIHKKKIPVYHDVFVYRLSL